MFTPENAPWYSDSERQVLNTITAVALAAVPRYLPKDYLEGSVLSSDIEREELAGKVAEAVSRVFEVRPKPLQIGLF